MKYKHHTLVIARKVDPMGPYLAYEWSDAYGVVVCSGANNGTSRKELISEAKGWLDEVLLKRESEAAE